MYAFRQRPLTWLFLIAMACLNVLAIATNFKLDWYADLQAAQLMIAGGWLALGRGHRLARAGVFLAVILVSAAPDFLFGNLDFFEGYLWPFVLGMVIFLATFTALCCWGWLLIVRLLERKPLRSPVHWRFTVAELLGWMIVVAVTTVVLPKAQFPLLFEPDDNWVLPGGICLVAALIMTLFLRCEPQRDVASTVIAALAIAAAVVSLKLYGRLDNRMSQLLAYVVIALWIVVQRLDENLAAAPVRK